MLDQKEKLMKSTGVTIYKRLPITLKRLLFLGKKRYCPVCQSQVRKLLRAGARNQRSDARCPICGSLERHRFVWSFFQNKTGLFDPPLKQMLHIGPGSALEPRLKKAPHLDYLSADLYNPRAMVKMDIANIQYAQDSFDVIYCSHVLEHVPDDLQAMRELYRVLKPGGWAVFQVPITDQKTIEDSSITDPAERERLYGKSDHVRHYGPDFKDRLETARFIVTVVSAREIVADGDLVRLSIIDKDVLFFCTKQQEHNQ